MTNRTRALAVLLSATAVPAMAQDPTAQTATTLARMQHASGGPRWNAIRTLHMVMTVTDGGVTGRGERWEDVVTGRYRERVTWPTHVSQEGFDGITSWREGRSGIAYTLGDVDAALVAANESYRVARAWWFADRHAATMALAGSAADGARACDIVNITPEAGRPFNLWIDHATHLPDRTDEQQAEDRVVTRFSDYRSVDGAMVPFNIRVGDGEDASADEIYSLQSVDINPPIQDSIFSIPARPPLDATLPPGATSIDVPFRLTADHRILVPLKVNGTLQLEAEFDSGGSLLLQPAAAAAAKLDVAGHFKAGGGGEGGTTSGAGQLDMLEIGAARFHNLSFNSFAFRPVEPKLALLGLEVLQRFVVRFDFDRQVMTLTLPEKFTYQGKGAVIPFHFQDNQPEIRGAVDGIAGLFAIDTGDNGSLLLIAPFARRYGLVQRYQADLPYSGTAIGATHGVWARKRPGLVTFNGPDGRPAIGVDHPVTRISLQQGGFDANRNVSANIGLGILDRFNLTFDYPRQVIILEPNRHYHERDIFNRAGLTLRPENGVWHVTNVYPGSAAASAGMAIGDIVTAIDGQSPATLGEEDLTKKLLAPVGTSLSLQIKTGKKLTSVALVLRDQI